MLLLILFCVYGCLPEMYVCVLHVAWWPGSPEEGIRFLRTGVTHEPPCGPWVLNPDPLDKHLVFLTVNPSF